MPVKKPNHFLQKPHQTFNLQQIESRAMQASGFEKPVISGLMGRVLVKEPDGSFSVFTPVKGMPGSYVRSRVANFSTSVDKDLRFRRGVSEARKKISERRAGTVPAVKRAEFQLDIGRREFGEIYLGLMNEINVRKKIDGRADPFDARIQAARQAQTEEIQRTQSSLQDIHTNFPERANTGVPYAGMTNDIGACIFVSEREGKPIITIRPRYPSESLSQEIGYVSQVVEAILKRLGINYKKT